MKRAREKEQPNKTKRVKSDAEYTGELPLELLQTIADKISDPETIINLTISSRFFYHNEECYRKNLKNFFDFSGTNEINKKLNQLELHTSQKKYKLLVKSFIKEYKNSKDLKIKKKLHTAIMNGNLLLFYSVLLENEHLEQSLIKMFGDTEDVKEDNNLFRQLLFTEKKDHNNKTPLANAALMGRKKIFFKLLEEGANPMADKIDKLHGNHLVMHDFVRDCAFYYSPINLLALTGRTDWLRTLFQEYSIHIKGSEKIFSEEYFKLLAYIIQGDDQGLSCALENNAFVLSSADQTGWTLLHWAVCFENIACINILLEKGAPIDAEASALSEGGPTPLHFALMCSNLSALEQLVNRNAKMQFFNSIVSPLAMAAYLNVDCLRYLLERNSDKSLVDAQNPDTQKTALHFALHNKNRDCANLLIEYGANLDIPDEHGVTPRQLQTQLENVLERDNQSAALPFSFG